MSDNPQVDPQAAPPAGAQNTEHMIPKSRFDEVNEQRKQFEAKLAEYQAKEQAQAQAEALARGQHQQVIDQLKPQAERAANLESVLKSYLQNEIESIPEKWRLLVPSGDVTEQLNWISNAKKSGLFSSPEKATPPSLDAAAGSTRTPSSNATLTPGEMEVARKSGLTPDEYIKYKKPN